MPQSFLSLKSIKQNITSQNTLLRTESSMKPGFCVTLSAPLRSTVTHTFLILAWGATLESEQVAPSIRRSGDSDPN